GQNGYDRTWHDHRKEHAILPLPGAPRSGQAGDRGRTGDEIDKPGPTPVPRGARGPNPVRLHRLVHSIRGQLSMARPRWPNARRPSHYNPPMATLFVSDLHLDAARPEITAHFLRFLATQARGADALYILGDLFEAWVGDDDPSDAGHAVAAGLRGLADAGVPVHFQRGNRDFLVGAAYATRAGFAILPDPAVIVLDGAPVLLSHGDQLCTDDEAYQAFRTQTRDPAWQSQFLSQPLQARLAFAVQARAASQQRQGELQQAGTMETITDVAPSAVDEVFARYGV